jgi:hypothetical protein
MTPENFTYWLKGFFEISGVTYLSEAQTQVVKDHLDLVFQKVTPDRAIETKSPYDKLFDQLIPIKGNPKEETRYC